MTETKLAFADRALAPGERDLLNRGAFVTNLVTAISSAPTNESIVFALYGKWGEGKTSTLSLMIDQFEKRDNKEKPSPAIIKFNPWVFSGREKLFQAFFEDIGNSIGASEELGGEERAKKFKRLASYTSLIGSGIKNVDSVLNLVGLSVPGSKLGGEALQQISEILKTGAEAENASTQPSLEKLKSSLVDNLEGADSPLLVVLDDIDRLPPPELVEIFQLLKSIADLPNVHYLLLCDRENVENNLTQQGFSADYLEKIIQFGATLPAVAPKTLSSLLIEGIIQIFKELAPEDHRINDHFRESLENGILTAHFTTLRNVKRFLGELRLCLPIHCGNGYFELNPHQFVLFTACRFFCPKGIELLRSNRAAFIPVRRGLWLGSDEQENKKKLLEFINSSFPELLEENGLSGYADLFSELLRSFEAEGFGNAHALEHRLIHSPTWFDCYFTLSHPQKVVSVAQAAELRKSPTMAIGETCSMIKTLSDELGYIPLFRHLITAAPSLFLDDSSNLMTALLSNRENPLCQDPDSGLFEGNIFETFLFWLKGSPEESHQERALKILRESENYRFFSFCFFMLGGEVNSSGEPHRILRGLEKPLMKETAKMIEQRAVEGDDLIEHYFGYVHDLWLNWGSLSKLKSWIRKVTQSNDQFVSYLRSLGQFRDATHEGESEPRRSFSIHHDRLASFPSIQSGIKRCKALLAEEAIAEDLQMILEESQREFKIAATFRKGERVLPKKLPKWVRPRFTIRDNLGLDSYYLFLVPCFGPNQIPASAEECQDRKNDLQTKLGATRTILGTISTTFPSSEAEAETYLVQANEDSVRAIANDLDLEAYFILRDKRQIILASAENRDRIVLGNLSDLTVTPNS